MKIKREFENKTYIINKYNKGLKIYLDFKYDYVGGISIIYYDESSDKIVKKNFNKNNLTYEKMSLGAFKFLANLYGVNNETYERMFKLFSEYLTDKQMMKFISLFKCLDTDKEKKVFRV